MIELSQVCRRYGGRPAVDGVSLFIAAGTAVGLVGPPGAGKSTLLRLIAGLTPSSSGDARVGGISAAENPTAVAAQVGYLPPEDVSDPYFTCAEFLRFHAACFGVPAADRAQLITDLLALVDLQSCSETAVDDLTPGMRRRLGMARALVNNPAVLLLDEPLRGLDPRARVDFRGLVQDLCAAGKVVLLTAAAAVDVRDLVSSIVHMQGGVVTAVESVEECRAERTISVRFLGDARVAENMLRAAHGVVDVSCVDPPDALSPYKEMRIVFASTYLDASALLRSLMHSAVQVITFTPPPGGGIVLEREFI